jgi:hypothetical protein
MLVGAILATIVGVGLHGSPAEVRINLEGEWPSTWPLLGLAAIVVCTFGPALAGTCLGLAALWSWRRLGRSGRLVRAAWAFWVLGPLPVLLLPLSYLFNLSAQDALTTSARNVGYVLTVTTPALFALLPGTLSAALVLKRFLPESRAPGQITLLAAPACTVCYLLPLAVLAQLSFHPGLYLGLLLLALSPVVPLLAVGKLLRRDPPSRATRVLRIISLAQGALAVPGLALVIRWLGEHPVLRDLIGEVSPVWVVGWVAKALASKWLTTVVVTDLVVSLLHQGRKSARSLAETAEGKALAEKLDALGPELRPAGRQKS